MVLRDKEDPSCFLGLLGGRITGFKRIVRIARPVEEGPRSLK